VSDHIKHECGIALIHLKHPISYYTKKYGSSLYGIDKMFLMMEEIRKMMEEILLSTILYQTIMEIFTPIEFPLV